MSRLCLLVISSVILVGYSVAGAQDDEVRSDSMIENSDLEDQIYENLDSEDVPVPPISQENLLLYKKYLDDIQQEYSLKNMNSYNLGGITSSNSRNITCAYEKDKKGDLNKLMDAVEQAEEGNLLCARSFVLVSALQLQHDIKKNCGGTPSELSEIQEKIKKAGKASDEEYCLHKARTGQLAVSEGSGSGFSFGDFLDIAVGVFAFRESLEGRDGVAIYQEYLRAKDPNYVPYYNSPSQTSPSNLNEQSVYSGDGRSNNQDLSSNTQNDGISSNQNSSNKTENKTEHKIDDLATASTCLSYSKLEPKRSTATRKHCVIESGNVCYDILHFILITNNCTDRRVNLKYKLGKWQKGIVVRPGKSEKVWCRQSLDECNGDLTPISARSTNPADSFYK